MKWWPIRWGGRFNRINLPVLTFCCSIQDVEKLLIIVDVTTNHRDVGDPAARGACGRVGHRNVMILPGKRGVQFRLLEEVSGNKTAKNPPQRRLMPPSFSMTR
jgi:hypothetical protein